MVNARDHCTARAFDVAKAATPAKSSYACAKKVKVAISAVSAKSS